MSAVYDSERNRRRLKQVQALAAQYQTTVSVIALSYLCSQPFVTVPIVGCKRLDHLHESLQAAGIRLTQDEVAALEAV